MAEKIYAKWIYWNPPHEKAPSFVLGSISIDWEKFDMEELKKHANGKYTKLDVLEGKEKPFVTINTYKKATTSSQDISF